MKATVIHLKNDPHCQENPNNYIRHDIALSPSALEEK